MLPISALSALLAATLSVELVNAHDVHGNVHRNVLHKRQTITGTGTVTGTSSATGTTATGAPATTGTTSGTAPPQQTGPPAGTGKYNVPPLSSLVMGMPSGPIPTLATTYQSGAVPSYSGAPPIPSGFSFQAGQWPALDQIPPTDSPEVKEWMKELDGKDIPNLKPTVDGECASDPEAAAQAKDRGWWTCGGWTSGNDIVACPDKMTWGVSFDDGPAPYSEKLLQYLDDHDLSATFFVVGSRVVSYPETLVAEYMAGHEISVHTWSHHPLTAMTNEQIVAEFGWTRKAIQDVIGVTPTTMRAPFGDIDNRVRAIANAMGLRPIIWTTGPGGPFDTNDWRVPAGVYTGPQQFQIFQNVLGNATLLDTGFIVLEHDLFEITVDLAVGYTLDAALSHQPPFKLQPIGECMKIATNDLYQETATTDIVGSGSSGSKGTGSNASNSSGSNSNNSTGAAEGNKNSAAGFRLPSSAFFGVVAASVVAAFAGLL